MKKTYFEAPALELVKVQAMQMMTGSKVNPGEEDEPVGSRGYSGFALADDTDEAEETYLTYSDT